MFGAVFIQVPYLLYVHILNFSSWNLAYGFSRVFKLQILEITAI